MMLSASCHYVKRVVNRHRTRAGHDTHLAHVLHLIMEDQPPPIVIDVFPKLEKVVNNNSVLITGTRTLVFEFTKHALLDEEKAFFVVCLDAMVNAYLELSHEGIQALDITEWGSVVLLAPFTLIFIIPSDGNLSGC